MEMADLPPPVREQITQFMAMSGPVQRGPDRLLARIPEGQSYEALCKILENAGKKNEREHETQREALRTSDHQHVRRMWLAGIGLVIVTAVIVLCIVTDKDDLARLLIPLLAGFVAGGAGGYGLGKASRD